MKFLKNNKMLEITEAEPNNAEEILEYLKKVGSESNFLLLDSNGLKATVEQEKKYIENIKTQTGSGLFIGKVEGQIVSVAGVHNRYNDKIKHNATLGISVLKDYWNQGVGNYMMEFAINFARIEQVIKNIDLEVRSDNENAIKLYEKFGFKEVGKYPDKFFIDGKYLDSIIMQLKL